MRTVLVVGDSMGHALARGLTEALARLPAVRVSDRTSPSSGLAGGGTDGWFSPVGGMNSAKPAAVVVMLGVNDRQGMREGSRRLAFRSAQWDAAFAARAAALAQAAAGAGAPVLWVGLPPLRAGRASADIPAFNEIFRTAAEANGADFVDIWDGFSDENGTFAAVGPGVDGQPTLLRLKDGVGFSRAGRLKLAFFLRKPLAKALGLPARPEDEAAALGDAAEGFVGPMAPDAEDDAEDGGGDAVLAGGTPAAGARPLPVPLDPPPVRGRADDFSRLP